MIDELNELRKANPYHADDLAEDVSLGRDDLIAALVADHAESTRVTGVADLAAERRARRRDPDRGSTVHGRAAWLGAVASLIVAIAAVGLLSSFRDGDKLDTDTVDLDVAEVPTTAPVERPTTTTSVVDEGGVSTPNSVDAAAVETPVASSIAVEQEREPATTLTPPPTVPTAADAAPSTTVAATSAPAEETVPATSVADTVDGPLNGGLDLLVVHFDFSHTDDGHAALATREATESFGLVPLVVAGTAQPDAFAHPYDTVMTSGWGDGWVDASADRSAAVSIATGRWLEVLDAGGDVWVAEGGVSDFTAEVLRRVRDSRPGLDTGTRIHVVHHAQRNEDETTPTDLAEVRATTDYVRIDDGNNANATADLNGASGDFEAAALAGQRATMWTAGFAYKPANQLDFSDTVTVLHILGVGLDEVADADDFADRFMR